MYYNVLAPILDFTRPHYFIFFPVKEMVKGGRADSHWSQYVSLKNYAVLAAFLEKNLQNTGIFVNKSRVSLVNGIGWKYDEHIPTSKN